MTALIFDSAERIIGHCSVPGYAWSQGDTAEAWRGPAGYEVGLRAGVGAILLAAAILCSLFVKVNWFSLHGIYRNRLVRTFLGASN